MSDIPASDPSKPISNQAISVLLPASTVAIFSKDAQTLEAGRNIELDWRFARVSLQVEDGDVSTAIDAYTDIPSPDLIIIQTENIDDSLPRALEDLADHCEEGTAAIVIGPVNDVDLYRRLIDMGVSDYLVKPVETDFFADVIAKTLIDKLGVIGSRLIAFVGAKGGVGTSALAQAAAWGVSDMLQQKTMFIDAAGGWSTAAVGMGFEPSTTLQEAVKAAENNDEDNLKRMLFSASERLSVLASGGEVMLEPTITPQQVEVLLDMLMTKYPVVVADLSHTAAELEKAIIARANHIITVSAPTLPSLRLARSLVQEIKDIRGGEVENMDLIVNMQGLAAANEVPKKDIEDAMDLKVSASISFEPKVFLGTESEGRKLTDDKEGYQIVRKTLMPILQKNMAFEKMDGDESSAPAGGLFEGLLGKLKG